MPREIFGDVSNPSVRLGSEAWYTVPVSIGAHTLLFTGAVIVPLMAADVLPSPPTMVAFVAPAPVPADLPPPPAAASRRPPTAKAEAPRDAAPVDAPTGIAVTPPVTPGPEEEGLPGGLPGGTPGGLPESVLGLESRVPPPAPPAPPQPVRPGGNIRIPTKVHHVAPVYPSMAQSARVEGTVVIEATIGTDGRVKDARVLASKPLLDQAAVDAVMKWRFTPTLLNGVPVPVLMTVTVTFTLSD